MKSLSHVWLFATPWTAASRAPRSMGFSKQEYWSGLPFPSPQSFLLERKCYCFRHLIETQTKCLSPTHSSKPGLNTISSAGTSGVPPIRISPPKGDVSWVFTGRTDVEAETPILWPPDAKSWLTGKDPDAGKDWGQEEKGMRGWDGWMASPTQWTWVCVDSRSWWWTRRPDVLRFMESQRVGHDWATELNWTSHSIYYLSTSVAYLATPMNVSTPNKPESMELNVKNPKNMPSTGL